jgi:hypothetical protein
MTELDIRRQAMNTPSVVLSSFLFAITFSGSTLAQFIPAGALIQCTISEPKLSSKTEAIGDPIVCQMSHALRSGRSVIPYGSDAIGRFEEYKDPGHLAGKGWMELKFDRMVIGSNTVVPMDAKVVDVSGYKVDREGRILGKGHTKRDAVEWMIPVLWPIDLINLPRSGPRPTLKAETRLTLKVMDDFIAPGWEPSQQGPSELLRRTPSAYTYTPHRTETNPVANPVVPANSSLALVSSSSVSPAQSAVPCGNPIAMNSRIPSSGSNGQNAVTLIFRDGRQPVQISNYMLTSTRLYVLDGNRCSIPVSQLDLEATTMVNRDAGIDFHISAAPIQYR